MRGYERHPYVMLQILCFTSRTYRGEKLFNQTIRRKFTKADVMKRLMKEQKKYFGALLETKKEKIRRIKREKKKQCTVQKVESNTDSEFWWIMKMSGSRLRHVKLTKYNNEFFDSSAPIQKNIFVKSMEVEEKTRPDEYSSAPILINERKSSNIERMKVNEAALSIKKSELKRVQERTFRKTSRSRRASKNLPEFVISENITSEMKNQLSQKSIICEIKRSNIASEVPIKATKVSPDMRQSEETKSKKVDGAKNSLLLPKVLDNNCNTTDMKFQGKATPLVGLSLEEIDKALLFNENEKAKEFGHPEFVDCGDVWQSSKILSLSATNNKESLVFPSVTKILSVTMSDKNKKILELWEARMIASLGQESFNEYKRDLFANGKLLHSSIESALRKEPFDVPENIKSCFDSVQSVLDEVTNVKAIESQIVHANLGYRGILDCVASYKGNLCLIDWKKSDKTKQSLSSTFDAPLQIASYIGALNADKNYPFQIKSGLLVFAYTRGNPPTVYELDEAKLQYYWKKWLERLKKYFAMQNT